MKTSETVSIGEKGLESLDVPNAGMETPSSKGINSMLQQVSRQGAVVLLTRGAALGLGLGSTVFLGRLLGPAGYGEFRIGSVVVTLLTSFCVLGQDRALFRYLPILESRGGDGARALLVRAGSFVFALSLALSAALLLGAPLVARSYFHSPHLTNVLRFFAIQLPILAFFRFFSGAVTGAKRIDFASKITNVVSPAIFLLLLIPTALYAGVYGAISARLVAQAAAVVCLIVFLLRHYPRIKNAAETSDIYHPYLRFALSLFLITLSNQVLNQMDTLMLGYFASGKEVGIYSVAFKVSVLVVMGPDIIFPIVAPLFSQFFESRDREATKVLFSAVTKWLCYSALLVFGCVVIFRAELLNTFGRGFAGGATVLVILAASQLANAASGPTGVVLTMTGKQRLEMMNVCLMLLVNFVLNLYLIPRMGKTGVAIATGFSIAAINAIRLCQVYRLFNLRAHSLKYFKGIGAVLIAAVLTISLRTGLLHLGLSPYVIICVGAVTFVIAAGATLWLFGLDGEDKLILSALWRR